MLNNHKREPGPENRGERSRFLYDKRPMHEKTLDLEDPHMISDDSKPGKIGKITELKSWIQRNTKIDDIFA